MNDRAYDWEPAERCRSALYGTHYDVPHTIGKDDVCPACGLDPCRVDCRRYVSRPVPTLGELAERLRGAA